MKDFDCINHKFILTLLQQTSRHGLDRIAITDSSECQSERKMNKVIEAFETKREKHNDLSR